MNVGSQRFEMREDAIGFLIFPPIQAPTTNPLSEGQVGPRAGFRYLKVPFTRLTC